jgi:two-component sensor histidine kinase
MSVVADLEPAGSLRDVALGMPIAADLSRSDLLLLRPINAHQVRVVAQARPRSTPPLHAEDLVGHVFTHRDAPTVFDALRKRKAVEKSIELSTGAPVTVDVRPVLGEGGRIAGLRITYLSGIANSLYRRLGYMEDLRGRHLNYLHTGDDVLAITAIQTRKAIEKEDRIGDFEWVRKVLPIWAPTTLRGRIDRVRAIHTPGDVGMVLIMVHDATDERRKKAELEVKSTMIQEVHHRVKNNLQNVAAVLRMQQRRAHEAETKQALTEAISRILSVAVIHEFLSLDESQSINVRDVCQRIVTQTRQGMTPGMQVEFSIEGPAIYLPSQQATATALVINELVQNALEHGYEHRQQGQIRVVLTDGGDSVKLEVCDDGEPLQEGFDLSNTNSLGLQIVRSLVQSDLRGEIRLENDPERGVVATVVYPKAVIGASAAVV